ncbi:hypothetical protein [Arthrobacter sp. AFG7.2]|nr:hypothetical protein [Arthrobacter sp. AFG7.2]
MAGGACDVNPALKHRFDGIHIIGSHDPGRSLLEAAVRRRHAGG